MSENDSPVLLEIGASGVARLTLNRPDAINAINHAIRTGLSEALSRCERDKQVRVVLVSGAGPRGFCAGGDIKELVAAETSTEIRARMTQLAWIEAFDQFSKPVIAAIHGFCLGGGCELALACDIRIASPDAQVGLPEVNLGILPAAGGTQRLPRLIGPARAMDMLLTGERIGAEEAWRIGLVTRLAKSKESLLEEAQGLAEQIAAKPPLAVTYIKEAARAASQMSLNDGLRLEKDFFALLRNTEDQREAALAFRDKRKPNFTGR